MDTNTARNPVFFEEQTTVAAMRIIAFHDDEADNREKRKEKNEWTTT